MNIWMLILLLNMANQQTLASFPLYFTPLGDSAKEMVKVSGKNYSVKWDGKNVSIIDDSVKVKCVFAYYEPGIENDPDYPPYASYLVLESNIEAVAVGSNVAEEKLYKYGIEIPSHPTYEEWVKSGSHIRRGKESGNVQIALLLIMLSTCVFWFFLVPYLIGGVTTIIDVWISVLVISFIVISYDIYRKYRK